MLCPVCKQSMMVVEHQGIELDHCISCKGTWFDEGELDLLFEDLAGGHQAVFEKPVETLADAQTDEKKRRCPRCRKKMKKIFIGDQPSILVDVCKHGEGIWFDSGEVQQFIQQTLNKLPGAAGKAVAFLGEVFQASPSKGGTS